MPLPLPPTAQPSVGDADVTSLNPPKKPVEPTGSCVTEEAYAGAAYATAAPATRADTATRTDDLMVFPYAYGSSRSPSTSTLRDLGVVVGMNRGDGHNGQPQLQDRGECG